jgi:hypothetical protein
MESFAALERSHARNLASSSPVKRKFRCECERFPRGEFVDNRSRIIESHRRCAF